MASPFPQDYLYLDYAATTPLDPTVKDVMVDVMAEVSGNPSSLHQLGQQAKSRVQQARDSIAKGFNTQPEEWTFTGSGTEANNLALMGVAKTQQHRGKHIITTSIEHAAIDAPCKALQAQGWSVTYLPVDSEGYVNPEDLKAAIRRDTVLVSVIHGHNEIGTVQDIAALSHITREQGVLFHTDAVQTAGKIPIDLAQWPGVDYLSLTAHKFYGPRGVGAFFIRGSAPKPEPIVYGGGQEGGLRSGTENVAAIVGMAKALEIAFEKVESESQRLIQLQRQCIQALEDAFPPGSNWKVTVNGPTDPSRRVPGNIHLSITTAEGEPVEGETLVLKLDLKGIGVSSGSACHSSRLEPSRMILALGKSTAEAVGTLRVSMGAYTQASDIHRLVDALRWISQRQPRKKESTLISS